MFLIVCTGFSLFLTGACDCRHVHQLTGAGDFLKLLGKFMFEENGEKSKGDFNNCYKKTFGK